MKYCFLFKYDTSKYWRISIHLMFLLIQHVLLAKRKLWLISIHPMFLLIVKIRIRSQAWLKISIHPMFLLISAFCPPLQLRLSLGGLALHRNFNTSHVSINPFDEDRIAQKKAHFNTSHVSINHERRNEHKNVIVISIHLMFLLIVHPLQLMRMCLMISIHLMFLLISQAGDAFSAANNFNTSHVSINHK